MKWLILLFILFTTPTYSCDIEREVTFNIQCPATIKINYSGLYGLVVEETREYLRDLYTDYNILLYKEEVIDFNEVRNRAARLNDEMMVFKWWERRWYCNSSVKTFTLGPTDDIINNGLFRLTSSFRFKLREFEYVMSGERSGGNFRTWGTKARISPYMSLNISGINRAGVNISLFLYRFNRSVAVLQFGGGYRVRYKWILEAGFSCDW